MIEATERDAVVNLLTHGTEWLLDEAIRVARYVMPPNSDVAVGVGERSRADGRVTHYAFIDGRFRGDHHFAASEEFDIAASRRVALAYLIVVLYGRAREWGVTIPKRGSEQ